MAGEVPEDRRVVSIKTVLERRKKNKRQVSLISTPKKILEEISELLYRLLHRNYALHIYMIYAAI